MSQELHDVYVKFREAIWRINAYVGQIVSEHEELSQYSEQQLQTLRVIKQHPNISQNDIAAFQGVYKTAISNRIKKLEQDGLVFIRADEDMRKKVVSLSSKGLQLIEQADKVIYGKLDELLGPVFTEEEIFAVVRQLDKAAQHFKMNKEVKK
ncbi:DNA-binding transcriptional regulator, MarR family [Alteribacillus persepolensis]|uniref:DNA-binding transcriptional regulator, MarR family n=1 Tax=Alteribacillus persepolensis TaxID=568899 RepID=A0A1G8JEX1_9BACI|nr:MarR family transcriptional regulator [Alteribacillus persepolensis]SDI29611.1 DNA-binding transcriptional regulator, MarR family [Alteribacillus persepolensis]